MEVMTIGELYLIAMLIVRLIQILEKLIVAAGAALLILLWVILRDNKKQEEKINAGKDSIKHKRGRF